MGKVKKDSKVSESFSKIPKKSHGAVQSIKSPKLRKTSVENVLQASSKTKKSKKGSKNMISLPKINQESNKTVLTKNKKKKSKPKVTGGDKSVLLTNFEEKFNIKIEDVKCAVEGVIQLRLKNPKVQNQLFDDDVFPISLIVNCHKIPTGHSQILRIPLAHTLLTPDDDVCLIVSEVKGIGNKEHDKHIEHYENLLANKGVTNIKKIMTVHEFKTEYETYEQKMRLVDLYDHFLACAKISGKVVKKCGSIFYKKRKIPTPIKLQSTKLKEHIDNQLSKAFFQLHLKGDGHYVTFGNSQMETSQIVENFVSIVEFLSQKFPGQFNNIKGLHITAPRASSIPVYISTKNPNEIPNVKVKTNNKFVPKAVKGELTTKLNVEVLVKPSGQVTVIRENSAKKRPHSVIEEENQSQNNEPDEIPRKKSKSGKKKLQKTESQVVLEEVSRKKVKSNKKKQEKNPSHLTSVKEYSEKKNKNVEIASDKVISQKSVKKIQKVKHLDNSIIIEDLSTTPPPKKVTKKKNQEGKNIEKIKKTMVKDDKKKKIKK